VLVVLADTTTLGKLFHVFTTLLEKQAFVDRILHETSHVSTLVTCIHYVK